MMTVLTVRLPFTSTPRAIVETSETSLVELCRAGDIRAFNELMARHQKWVYNLCLRHLRDPDAAADAAQDVFIGAYKGLKSFRGNCAFSTWLHRITVNRIHDAVSRLNCALPIFSVSETADAAISEPIAPLCDEPDESATRRERHRLVCEALDALPQSARMVIILFDVQGYTYEEIARILSLPLGTVKSRLYRARAALRTQLTLCREVFED